MLKTERHPSLGIIKKVARDLISTSDICRRRLGCYQEDYIAIGYMAYLRAKKNYKPELGVPFYSYAYVVIKHRILLEAYSSHLVRMPSYIIWPAKRLSEGLQPLKKDAEMYRAETLEHARKLFDGEQMVFFEDNEEKQLDWGLLDEGDYETLAEADVTNYIATVIDWALNQLDEQSKTIMIHWFGLRGKKPKAFLAACKVAGCGETKGTRLRAEALEKMRKYLDGMFGEAVYGHR